MSMQPHPWPEVPASTARVAKRAFRKGSLAMRARDELGAWCQDEAFRVTYGTRGAPGISPAQLAMVTVLQFTENLTDRQAADAVRGRLDWKYCLGLELDDEGFDFSVLSEFRSRLVAGGMEAALLEVLLARLVLPVTQDEDVAVIDGEGVRGCGSGPIPPTCWAGSGT
jgi:transposase